jgi:hypothetical protein
MKAVGIAMVVELLGENCNFNAKNAPWLNQEKYQHAHQDQHKTKISVKSPPALGKFINQSTCPARCTFNFASKSPSSKNLPQLPKVDMIISFVIMPVAIGRCDYHRDLSSNVIANHQ